MNEHLERIRHYFPQLTEAMLNSLRQMHDLYLEWNAKINLVSRKDIDLLYERHILHSLSIAKVIQFKEGASVMDLGTGGGFPGLPLAVMFPDTEFYLVDSIGKKIKVVQDIAQALGLHNVRAAHTRAEQIDEEFDFVVSRAVAPLGQLADWTRNKFFTMYNHPLKNGIICLKGGDLREELAPFQKKIKVWELKDFFTEEFFDTKKIVYLPMI